MCLHVRVCVMTSSYPFYVPFLTVAIDESDVEKPKFTDADRDKVAKNYKPEPIDGTNVTETSLKNNVKLIVHTCNQNEYWAVLERLTPPTPKGYSEPLQYCPELDCGTITAVVGKLAKHTVAVLFTQQSLLAESPLEDALKDFPNAQAIVAIGIGYGKDRDSINFADVMVSEKIEDCSQVKIEQGPNIKQRGPRYSVDQTLLQHFSKRKLEWNGTFRVTKSTTPRSSKAKFGVIVSAPILMKDELLKLEFMKLVDKTIGGEMEGFVLLNLVKKMRKEKRQLCTIVMHQSSC